MFSQDVVDVVLERGGSITESKGHDKILEKSEVGTERGLPFVAFLNPQSVEGRDDVQLGANFGLGQTSKGFCDQGKWVAVLDGDFIQSSVVNTEAETSSMFPYKQDR